jgi:hypothetical protein
MEYGTNTTAPYKQEIEEKIQVSQLNYMISCVVLVLEYLNKQSSFFKKKLFSLHLVEICMQHIFVV